MMKTLSDILPQALSNLSETAFASGCKGSGERLCAKRQPQRDLGRVKPLA
jgi:hypothetical protein